MKRIPYKEVRKYALRMIAERGTLLEPVEVWRLLVDSNLYTFAATISVLDRTRIQDVYKTVSDRLNKELLKA